MLQPKRFFSLVLLGAIGCLGFLSPSSPKDISWVQMILVLAPTLLLPLWLSRSLRAKAPILLLSAWAFGGAYCWSPGLLAGVLASIWLLCTLWLAHFFLGIKNDDKRRPSHWSGKAAFLFLPIGAAWAVADRLGWHPMGFQSTIVLLTAVHFHYAGFLLLSLTDQHLRLSEKPWHTWVDLSLVAGVPLVAIGITMTEWNGPAWIETFAATVMALSGLGASYVLLKEGWENGNSRMRVLMILGSSCLGLGMILAIAYGWRPYLTLPWLDIPWMYAVHGSLNASGITLLLLGSLGHQIKKGTGSL